MMNLDYSTCLQRKPDAKALLRGNNTNIRGFISLYNVPGGTLIKAEFSGLPCPDDHCGAPVFGFHIHQGESCSGNNTDPFADALGHFNPDNCSHPYHAGDLPPIFGCNGRGFSVFLTNRFRIRDVIGKTMILHAMADDFHTQPSGNSGEKIACGIIRKC